MMEKLPKESDYEPDMVTMQGGRFAMGGNEHHNEKSIHYVTLSSFKIAKYETTLALWQNVMGSNPSGRKDCMDCPVTGVSWDDIQTFIKKLNTLPGKHYRLPTEAEWEYAARGGIKSKKFEYAGSNDVNAVAWTYANSGSNPHPVGQKEANELGLYDMSGNVWNEFKQLSAELSTIMPKQFAGFKTAVDQKDELRICCGNLLRNASNTLIASTDLLRNGFRFQSGILIRSIIEICATVVHLLVEKDALVDFKHDRLSSTRSISVADKQVPLFGKAWGILSKFNIHINTNHADWYPMIEYTDKNEIPSSVILGVLGYAMLILDIVTELTFIDELEDPDYWKVLEPGKLQFIPPTEDRIEWAKEILKDTKA